MNPTQLDLPVLTLLLKGLLLAAPLTALLLLAGHPLAVTGCSLAVLGAAVLIGMATVSEVSAEPVERDEKAENGKKLEGQKLIEAKLKQIEIPVMDFDETTLEEALDFLRSRSIELDPMELDPKKKGINFLIQLNKEERKALAGKTITLKLRNVPMSIALKYTTRAVGLNYRVSEFAVEFEKN